MNNHHLIKIAAFFMLVLGATDNIPVYPTMRHVPAGLLRKSVDLPQILARKKIVALTTNSSTNYFIYKGEPMGYEYEMLQSFAKKLNVDLEIVVAKNLDDIFELLKNGDVDIIASNLTITEERLKEVNFTDPLLYTRQVLVQRKPDNWRNMSAEEMDKHLIRKTTELGGKNIHVRKNTSLYHRLISIQKEVASKINIVEARKELTSEELITMVANGKIPYTLADENVAKVNQAYFPHIDVKTTVSPSQKVGWAVSKNSPLLLKELNCWIGDKKNGLKYALIYNKYFRNPKGAWKRAESEFSSIYGNKISPYDDIIIKYSGDIGWDWRLLASMIYQESTFNPNAESWAGAKGLMQLMPSTALLCGLDTTYNASPVQSIKGGTRYIARLDKYWSKSITDKNERIKFVLASYNVGLGHVIDAKNLAKKYGKNPTIWQDNVEIFVLLKSKARYYTDPIVRYGYCRGEEPYNYVREILSRCEHYKNTMTENSFTSSI